MPMCRVFSYVVGRGCLLWPVRSLGKTLLAFALFHSVLQGKFTLFPRYFLTSYFFIPVPYDEKFICWGVLVLERLVGLHRTIQFQLLQHYWSEHRLGLLWYWMVCLGNEQRSFQTLADYDGYSISSKGFLPRVVDIMVSWVKFTHSSPFYIADS